MNTNSELKIKELKEKVSQSCRIIYKMGLATFMEHVSARVPGESMLITNPFGSLEKIKPGDLIVVDFNADLVEGTIKPRGWTLLHIEIFKARKECNGIVHTHQPMGLVFGITDRRVVSLLHSACSNSSKETSTYENPDVLNEIDWDRAKEIVKSIGNRDICHIQGHGIEFLGNSVEDATISAIQFEQQCTINYLTTSVGFPRPISKESVERMKQFHQKDLLPRCWKYYCDLIKQDDDKEEREKESYFLLKSLNEKLNS